MSQIWPVNIVDESPIDGRHKRVLIGKQKVVEASIDLLLEGQAILSFAQISRQAGLSERTVSRYFDSFNELIDDGLIEVHLRTAHLFTTDVPDAPVEERLRLIAKLRLELVRQYDALSQAMERLAVRYSAAEKAVVFRDQLLADQFNAWFASDRTTIEETDLVLFELMLGYDAVRAINHRLGEHAEDTIVSVGARLLGNPSTCSS